MIAIPAPSSGTPRVAFQPLSSMPYAMIADHLPSGYPIAGPVDGSVWFSADYGDRGAKPPVELGRIQMTFLVLTKNY